MKLIALLTMLIGAGLGPAAVDAAWDPLQKARRAASDGQRHLAAGDTVAAVQSWLQAQSLDPDDPEIGMGLAETLFRTGQFKSSMGQYSSLADPTEPERNQLALYNAGTSAFAAQDLEKALEMYTQALIQSDGPPDPDLLYNLELTQQMLEQAQSQSEQQGESDQSEDGESQENQDQPDQQQPQEQQPSPEEQPQDESQSQEEQQQEQEPQEGEQGEEESEEPEPEPEPAPPDTTQVPPPEPAAADSLMAIPEGMTPQDALRLLDALDHDEEELRKSIQRRLRGTDTKSKKDW